MSCIIRAFCKYYEKSCNPNHPNHNYKDCAVFSDFKTAVDWVIDQRDDI